MHAMAAAVQLLCHVGRGYIKGSTVSKGVRDEWSPHRCMRQQQKGQPSMEAGTCSH
jgi:hypothetical protein